jgi:crotonobetainyl-CoA:carnitine CoA-transferase CaiB-like acyl-CoA transferase
VRAREFVAALGEHNTHVLREFGWSRDAIDGLASRGVLRGMAPEAGRRTLS